MKLPPAGATWPYGKDLEDRNSRIAPTFPSVEEIDRATRAFVLCARLGTVQQRLSAL